MLSQEILKELLHYDSETGVFTWKETRAANAKIGAVAGTKTSKGYLDVCVARRQYKAHRLAWLYVNGAFPQTQIDHINGNKSDNRIVNLRLATPSQNKCNTPTYRNNKSGYKGVSWFKNRSKWAAQCQVSGKNKVIGFFETPELASRAYQEFAKNHHGDFYYESRA